MLILKTKRPLKLLHRQITFILLIVLFFSMVTITKGQLSQQKKEVPLSNRVLSINNTIRLPDIYYIILDGHATEKSLLAEVKYEYTHNFSNFELAFLRTNIFARLINFIPINPRQLHRNRILNEFSYLKQLALESHPTFTFAHILSPHPPFVFTQTGQESNKNGRFTLVDGFGSVNSKEEYQNGYREQLLYIDQQLILAVDYILNHSPTPPIIIIQSDHGLASEIRWENNPGIFLSDVIDTENPTSVYERTGILNAYYFPYGGSEKLYPTITPVNSFRILFNYYFNGDFPLLEDKTFIDR